MLNAVNTIGGNIYGVSSVIGSISGVNGIEGGAFAPNGIGALIPDESLSKSGRAADAKIVGERLDLLDRKIETLETEVGDASILLSLI